MRLYEILAEVRIDNLDGAGAVPLNDNVDYMGLRVLMRPSVFLKLAAVLDHEKSVDGLINYIKDGGAIASPFLLVVIPPEWEDADFSKPAWVRGHEGRNRMVAVQRLEGDEPIETHLFFAQGLRRRNITDAMIEQINKYLVSEEGSAHSFDGPYFTVMNG